MSAKRRRNYARCRIRQPVTRAQNDELTNRLAWRTRIFEDRQKATSYVCDVPVQLEKRLFDLSSAIQRRSE